MNHVKVDLEDLHSIYPTWRTGYEAKFRVYGYYLVHKNVANT